MSMTFFRTIRSLKADRPKRRPMAVLLALLLSVWGGWFLAGRVTVYEVTTTARLESRSQSHPVAVKLAGQVVETRLALGQVVREGDVLVELDSEADRLALAERQAARRAVQSKLTAVAGELAAEETALQAEAAAREAAVREAQAELVTAEVKAKFSAERLVADKELRRRGANTDFDLKKSLEEVELCQTQIVTLGRGIERLSRERQVQESACQTRIAKLKGTAIELTGQMEVEDAAIARLQHTIDRCIVRSPVSGRIGDLAEIRPGSVVKAADKLASIIPDAEPRAIAFFPVAAVGRLKPGQPVRLRLDGFPWTQYGMLSGTVANVGTEPIEGRVQVELSLPRDMVTSIPIGHGLPGAAEVAVEQISPAELVLRAAGQWLQPKREPVSSVAVAAK